MEKLRKPMMIAAALLVALLIGLLIGQYRIGRVKQQLEAERLQMASLRVETEMGAIRDTAALMYVEVNRKNYGLAGQHATRYFQQVAELAQAMQDPHARANFASLLERRDAVATALAAADPQALQQIEKLYFETYRATRQDAE
jgi:hypothetical protein